MSQPSPKPQGPTQDKGSTEGISAREVNQLHGKSDVDSGTFAQHHTLGIRHHQAAAGDHTHDGKGTKQLLAGVILTGAKGGNAALASVISALVGLGATDSTT